MTYFHLIDILLLKKHESLTEYFKIDYTYSQTSTNACIPSDYPVNKHLKMHYLIDFGPWNQYIQTHYIYDKNSYILYISDD